MLVCSSGPIYFFKYCLNFFFLLCTSLILTVSIALHVNSLRTIKMEKWLKRKPYLFWHRMNKIYTNDLQHMLDLLAITPWVLKMALTWRATKSQAGLSVLSFLWRKLMKTSASQYRRLSLGELERVRRPCFPPYIHFIKTFKRTKYLLNFAKEETNEKNHIIVDFHFMKKCSLCCHFPVFHSYIVCRRKKKKLEEKRLSFLYFSLVILWHIFFSSSWSNLKIHAVVRIPVAFFGYLLSGKGCWHR